MRDIGYTFETALADIIDNSITANSRNVRISLDLEGSEPALAILDDGVGMSHDALIEAMRLGSRNPLEVRDKHDLGRFGLGLKTASFSQCRRLTVVTRQSGQQSAARWDLDHVAEADEWMLQLLNEDAVKQLPFTENLEASGTLVIWEKLDRLSDTTGRTSLTDHLYERLQSAENHLALVFHRFINGERPYKKVDITINEAVLKAYDPFNSRHPSTTQLREEVIQVDGQAIKIQPYILPHHSKVSRTEWAEHGGEAGYAKNQGFYVYRAGRLIIHGTWFRLTRQTELTKLARVRIDLPNGLDHLWNLDVKKAWAHPPQIVRERLRQIIDQISNASNRVYTSRGRKLTGDDATPMWNRRIEHGRIHYEINPNHPLVKGFISTLSEHSKKQLPCLIQAIERCFPVDALFSDMAGHPEDVNSETVPEDKLLEMLEMTVSVMAGQDMPAKDIRQIILQMEPYRSHESASHDYLNKVLQEH